MNISKINIFNTNKQRVSPFRGDTLVSENNTNNNKDGQTFLYGACTVSAGILAVALANRAGLFSKNANKLAKETKKIVTESDPLKNNPIVKAIKSNEILTETEIGESREQRLAANIINPLATLTNIKYPKSIAEIGPANQRSFFDGTMHKISEMSYEDQYDEFKFLLKGLKKQPTENLYWEFGGIPGNLKRDNYDRFANEINAVTQEVPELDNTVFFQYRFNEAVNKMDFSLCDRLNRKEEKTRFFTNVMNKIYDMPYEEQPNGMKTMLDALKQENLEGFNWTCTPARHNFKGDNFDKIANLINEATQEKPELNDTVFKPYRINEALDTWNLGYCDNLKTKEEKSGFFSRFLDRIYGMQYHDQQKGMDTLLEALTKQDLKTFTWNCLPRPDKLHGDNYGRFINSINEISSQIPEMNNTVFYKLRMKEALDKEDFSFYKNLKTETDKKEFLNSYMHKIYGMSSDDQPKAFDAVLTAVKEENPKTFKWNFRLLPQYLKNDNHKKFIDAINKLTAEKPELNDTVFYTYRIAEALEKNDYSIYRKLKTEGEQAGFLTNIYNKLTRVNADNLESEFSKYLDFIKTIPKHNLKHKILFNIGEFAPDKNINIAKMAIQFAKDNPEYSDIMVRHLVKYTPDKTFMQELTHQPISTQDTRILHNENNLRAWCEPGKRTEGNKKTYDKHIENAIKIRNLLIESGLKADKHARIINRADWFNPQNYNFNKLDVIFADYPNIHKLRKSAFKYDLMNGILKQDADEMIKYLTSQNKTCQGTTCHKVYGMQLDDMVNLINKSVINVNTQA